MISKIVAAERTASVVDRDSRWHPGACVMVAIVLALASWAPVLVAGALLS
ncbi:MULTISPECIES: hypothetical protein [unclassified Sphingomonas]|nr:MULTISPECIES: hypothetical protein [unclassified Sphingomonas]